MWRYLSTALWNRVTGSTWLLEKLSSFMWEPGVWEHPKRGAVCQPPTHRPNSDTHHGSPTAAYIWVFVSQLVIAGQPSALSVAYNPPGVFGISWLYSLSCSLCVFLQLWGPHKMAWVTWIWDCSYINRLRRGRITGDGTLSRVDLSKMSLKRV